MRKEDDDAWRTETSCGCEMYTRRGWWSEWFGATRHQVRSDIGNVSSWP